MSTVSIRLSEGLYAAVGELASRIGVDKSDMTTLLLYMGLSAIKKEAVSEGTWALIWADAMESYVSVVRALARLAPAKRKEAQKPIQDFISKLTAMMALPEGDVGGDVERKDR
jgi:hypothetical protein